MQFDIVTVHPSICLGPLDQGVVAKARRAGRISVRVHDLRRFGLGPHRIVDDAPYGGGGGMVLRPEPLFDAVEWIRATYPARSDRVILLSPQGRRFDHRLAQEALRWERVVLLCGRYEGVDERVRQSLAQEEWSVGDFVLTGGELPALLVVDAVSRFVPEVLGNRESALQDSFCSGTLEHPHYTRPAEYRGLRVPEVLTGGDHERIRAWRAERSRVATEKKRPDLLRGSETGEDGRERN